MGFRIEEFAFYSNCSGHIQEGFKGIAMEISFFNLILITKNITQACCCQESGLQEACGTDEELFEPWSSGRGCYLQGVVILKSTCGMNCYKGINLQLFSFQMCSFLRLAFLKILYACSTFSPPLSQFIEESFTSYPSKNLLLCIALVKPSRTPNCGTDQMYWFWY